MRIKIGKNIAFFKYGSSGNTELTPFNINEWYKKLGGCISPETELEFVNYFPGTLYEKTALTEHMRQTYLCEGSGSAVIYQPSGQVDYLSISIYRDTTPNAISTGGHHNLFLQYRIGKRKPTHTDKIPGRHLPLHSSVILQGIVDGEILMSETINAQS